MRNLDSSSVKIFCVNILGKGDASAKFNPDVLNLVGKVSSGGKQKIYSSKRRNGDRNYERAISGGNYSIRAKW